MGDDDQRDAGLALARALLGGNTGIADLFGITRGAVAQWEKVPVHRVPLIAEKTGRPHHEYRPDVFPVPAE